MKEASLGFSPVEFARGFFCGLKAGTREVIREATPPEFRRPARRQPEECDHLKVDPQMQPTTDAQRFTEVRWSLRSFIPQGGGKRGESSGVVSQPTILPVPVVRNRG